jgi:ABC-type uncharacterized transport system, periplasmic component
MGTHPQLDAVNTNFRSELAKQGYVEGKDVVFDWEVANFDASILPQILNKLKSQSPKLIMTISTPVAQSAKQSLKGAGIPIVFAAITDPIKAKLVADWDHGAEDMTGSSDQQSAPSIIAFTQKLIPGIKKLGMLYNPGEDNNLSVLERLKAAGKEASVEIVEAGCDNAADIPIRVASLKGRRRRCSCLGRHDAAGDSGHLGVRRADRAPDHQLIRGRRARRARARRL